MRRPGAPTDRDGGEDDTGVIRTTFDWAETPPAMAVVETLAVATDTEILGVDPLVDHLDPDALNALIADEDRPDAGTVVSFRMTGHEVSVHADGTLVLVPMDSER
ncbi:HalOD1 output domain-containing protein [Haloarchaeobius salinus]|uniref:HalOD1 output domain-containing protein n=1 Tax=Haloarchaeobius salinus TaxID=1198298 RepID=UPI00210C4B3A|nr:HalOD1 output domain-containing protein [Haloarchaeobius salinus]